MVRILLTMVRTSTAISPNFIESGIEFRVKNDTDNTNDAVILVNEKMNCEKQERRNHILYPN